MEIPSMLAHDIISFNSTPSPAHSLSEAYTINTTNIVPDDGDAGSDLGFSDVNEHSEQHKMANSVPPPAISQLVLAASPHPKPHPKPCPVFLPSSVDKHPDQFSQLGCSWPWIPSDISPMPSSATVPSPTASMTSIHASIAISTPAPPLMSALKLQAAIEKEAKGCSSYVGLYQLMASTCCSYQSSCGIKHCCIHC